MTAPYDSKPVGFVAQLIGLNDDANLAREQEMERRERAEQDARRKAATEAEPLDAASARHAEPALTRTEAIKARYANEPRVTFPCGADAGQTLACVDGVYIGQSWFSADDSLDIAMPAKCIIARIDAALAKPAQQATRPEVGGVHPWAVARADMEAHSEARWLFANAPHRIQSDVLLKLGPSGWREPAIGGSVFGQHTWTRLPDDLAPQESTAPEAAKPVQGETPAKMACMCSDDVPFSCLACQLINENAMRMQNERRRLSLAIDEVTKLRRTHADLGSAIERLTALFGGGRE